MDRLIGYLCAILLIPMLGWNIYDFGKAMGKREALAGMKCPGTSAYHFVDGRTGKCAIKESKAPIGKDAAKSTRNAGK